MMPEDEVPNRRMDQPPTGRSSEKEHEQVDPRIAAEDALVPAAAQHFACRFGGVYFDAAGTAIVTVVNPQPEDSEWAARQGAPAEIREARYGYADLDGWVRAVDAVAREGKLSLLTQANVELSAVDVYAARLSEDTERRLREAVPADALRIVERSDFVLEPAHGSPSNWNAMVPHYEASLQVNIKLACTTGFYVANGYGPFGTTAGHCGPTNWGVQSPDGSFSDLVRQNTYGVAPNESDALSFSTASIWNYPRVMQLGPCCNHLDVTSRFSAPNPSVGYPGICRVGISSNNVRCGSVNVANGFKTDASGVSTRVWCFRTQSIPGDSGGPVYKVNIGGSSVHAAGLTAMAGSINGEATTCYSHIYYVLRDLGSSLVYPTY